jgi:hypothetical protein
VLSVETREDTFRIIKCILCYLALIIDQAGQILSSKYVFAKPLSLFDRVLVCFRYTPRTSQSAGFDIGAFIVSTYYTHKVEKFAAQTAPGNCPHSTEHTT